MVNRIRHKSAVVALVMVMVMTMTGCADSAVGVSSDTTPTVASSEQANAESQPTQDPANVKPAQTGPQPTALPTQALPMQGTDANGDGFYTPAEFKAAIFRLIDYYEWPGAYTPDTVAFSERFDASALAEVEHEVPGEYTIVGRQYQCAWSLNWLDAFASGDPATMDLSVGNLRDELALNPMFPPSTQEYKKGMYDKASLGDPALLQQFVNVNCGGMEWIDQPGVPG